MNSLSQLIKRNIKVFLRDRVSVFFSFLSVIIIILLYVLFLGDMQYQNIVSEVGKTEGIRELVDTWIVAGIVIINTITTSLASLGIVVKDRQNGALKDFLVSPIKRSKVALSYIMATWMVAFILTMISFVFGEFYILLNGGSLVSFIQLIEVIFIIMISIISFSSPLFFIMLFLKTESSFGTLSTIVGTFIGFLTGIYIPIGVFTPAIQTIIKLFTPTYMLVMLRTILMENSLSKVFANAPLEVINEYKSFNGVSIELFKNNLSSFELIGFTLFIGLVFYLLVIMKISKMKEK